MTKTPLCWRAVLLLGFCGYSLASGEKRVQSEFDDDGLRSMVLTGQDNGGREVRGTILFAGSQELRSAGPVGDYAEDKLRLVENARRTDGPCIAMDPRLRVADRVFPTPVVDGELLASGRVTRVVNGFVHTGLAQAIEIAVETPEDLPLGRLWLVMEGGDLSYDGRRICQTWQSNVPQEGDRLLLGTYREALEDAISTRRPLMTMYYSVGLVRNGSVLRVPFRLELPHHTETSLVEAMKKSITGRLAQMSEKGRQ